MSTTLESQPAAASDAAPGESLESRPPRGAAGTSNSWLAALASLRLTVTLFALAIFLVFVGTLAQKDHDVWYVVEQNYFRVWVATVEWQTFVRLVEMFTKAETPPITGGFLFPGGKLIGVVMFANLLAAHAVRFKVAAKGTRLAWGSVLLAGGVAATAAVLATGLDTSLVGQLSPEFCDGLWQTLRAALAGVALVGAYMTMQKYGHLRPAEWWLLAAFNAVLLGLAGYLFAYPTVAPDDAGMRIVWQLTKCGGAALLCLAGCWVVFRQRAGIVLLHAGIGLLMVGELVTDLAAVEGVMSIPEGGAVNYAEDIRHVELAIVTDEADAQRVTVVPQNVLAKAAASGEVVSHPDLPFDLRVVRFDENSLLAPPMAVNENPATVGAGLERVAITSKSVSGVAVSAGVNRPSAYVEPIDKQTGESLGVWLVSASFMPMDGGGGTSLLPQTIDVDGTPYEVDLRFKRLYKDYSVTLTDFRFDRYAGTNVPKNFQSDIVLSDPSRDVERPVKIWMNNPLRYAGDTIYQQSFDEVTERSTVLQVVTNGGWMIPYVSCVLVGLGMLTHFSLTLTRFARRRVEEANRLAAKSETRSDAGPSLLSAEAWAQPIVWAPALAALLTVGYLGSKTRPAVDEPGAMAVERFGALPVAEGGRIKPIDTLARTTLQAISARQEVLPAEKGEPRVSAITWLLDTISARKGWDTHRVFRIESLELLDALGLPPRQGSFRYSYAEVMKDPSVLGGQVDQALARRREIAAAQAQGRPAEPLSLVQEQTLGLADKVSLLHQLASAFGEPRIDGDSEEAVRQQLLEAQARGEQLGKSGAVRVVPPTEPTGEWTTLYQSNLANLMRLVMKQPLEPAGAAWSDALTAYARGDAAQFADELTDIEAAVEKYQRSLEATPEALAGLAGSERLDTGAVRFEHFFSHFSPFYYCAAMYLLAFVLTACGWLGQGSWSRALGRAALAVIVVTLCVHTFALVGRIYISGRPPVTNLYSSAVFIGWAAVLFGVAFEAIYKLSVGSAVASVLGFATLVVAHYLSLDGDTYTVLSAVLDTQFWLATHVVCVTLGYSTTFLAGFLGAGYLIAACGPRLWGGASRLDKRAGDQLVRMIYGTLCFALLFSFVGTVLGGLWADDSWGRFWGWDPKENGALIIVLWNALVLHARWGRMIGPVGLSALAVGGNIVTTWSWFGVNELGVGLHAYGASESNTATMLLFFAASQLVVIALATLRPRIKSV
ncbi:Cytochrome c biogenesis protein CcsA [Botrimarina colliarenosi]|uniref:Cytochrome c biogenesis protein CcsA n=1 Tax=Botrimarina colliarenosi TaxID=2528001 RepID=A0A5C6AJI0_9BACT|nr:cytochrome c biogenesis protein CcsA [Botrimarina colliarenosi]TWU00213.1 Cytochrome c biogenesis protein CcsA [Botrimarina colliarenosi]